MRLGTPASAGTASPAADPKISHAVLLTSAQLSRGVARLLLVVVARALGPERFGVYALLLAMIEMLAVASGSGFIDYLGREAAKDERLGWGLAAQLTWLRAAYAIPFTGAGLGILWLCGYPRLVLIGTACMSLTLIPRSLSEGIQGVLRGTGRQVEFFIVELAFGLTLATSAVVLLVRGGGLSAAVITELAAVGKPDAGQQTPPLVADRAAAQTRGGELFDGGVEVVAHQVQLVRACALDRMHGHLGRRQLGDEQAASGVDVRVENSW